MIALSSDKYYYFGIFQTIAFLLFEEYWGDPYMHVGVNVAVIVLFLQIMGFIILAYAFFEMYRNRKEQISVTLDQISYTDDQLLSSEESIISLNMCRYHKRGMMLR